MALKDWITPTTAKGSKSLATHSPSIPPTFLATNSRNSKASNSKHTNFTHTVTLETQLSPHSSPPNSRNSRNSNSKPSENILHGYPKAERRLQSAAQGLPVTLEELLAFYAVDLPAFEAGEVPQATIRFSVELYAKKKESNIWIERWWYFERLWHYPTGRNHSAFFMPEYLFSVLSKCPTEHKRYRAGYR